MNTQKDDAGMEVKWVIPAEFSFADKVRIWKRAAKWAGFGKMFRYFIFQYIFRINSDVPWPVHTSSVVLASEKIKYQNWSNLSPALGYSNGCYIQAANGIEIGINFWAGPGLKILSVNHDVNDYTKHISADPIKFGENVWIGADVIILPSVELGDHTIVAAGAVVNKSFKQGNCILAGVPAKVVKELPDYHGGCA